MLNEEQYKSEIFIKRTYEELENLETEVLEEKLKSGNESSFYEDIISDILSNR